MSKTASDFYNEYTALRKSLKEPTFSEFLDSLEEASKEVRQRFFEHWKHDISYRNPPDGFENSYARQHFSIESHPKVFIALQRAMRSVDLDLCYGILPELLRAVSDVSDDNIDVFRKCAKLRLVNRKIATPLVLASNCRDDQHLQEIGSQLYKTQKQRTQFAAACLIFERFEVFARVVYGIQASAIEAEIASILSEGLPVSLSADARSQHELSDQASQYLQRFMHRAQKEGSQFSDVAKSPSGRETGLQLSDLTRLIQGITTSGLSDNFRRQNLELLRKNPEHNTKSALDCFQRLRNSSSALAFHRAITDFLPVDYVLASAAESVLLRKQLSADFASWVRSSYRDGSNQCKRAIARRLLEFHPFVSFQILGESESPFKMIQEVLELDSVEDTEMLELYARLNPVVDAFRNCYQAGFTEDDFRVVSNLPTQRLKQLLSTTILSFDDSFDEHIVDLLTLSIDLTKVVFETSEQLQKVPFSALQAAGDETKRAAIGKLSKMTQDRELLTSALASSAVLHAVQAGIITKAEDLQRIVCEGRSAYARPLL